METQAQDNKAEKPSTEALIQTEWETINPSAIGGGNIVVRNPTAK